MQIANTLLLTFAGLTLVSFVLVRLCIMAEERDRSQIDDPYDTDYWNKG